ncbi:MAG TPA: aldo/keto reductase [Steroidobacteraceae bacterium]|nr:aldo/keto reductase [Steroidobacteraceae bacterium]
MNGSDDWRLTRRGALAASLLMGGALLLRRAARADGSPATRLPLIEKAIPASGEKLPVVGVGTNAFTARSPDDLAKRRAVLQALPELGGKVIDTAAIYGESEAVIGEAVQSFAIRARVFLATKVMARDSGSGEASIEESFRRLATPRIDLFQVHNLMDMDQMVPRLQALKRAGRVRYVGITTSQPQDHERMADAMAKYPLDFIQVDYSIGSRDAANRVLPLAQDRGLAVLINVPFGGRRGANAVFAQVRGRKLPDWAPEIDVTSWGQLFLKYVVSHPAVTCAIPGTTEVSHLRDNLAAAHGRLPDAALRKRIETLWDSFA